MTTPAVPTVPTPPAEMTPPLTPVQTAQRSALPAWLFEVLPQWWMDRPAFTELVWAGSLSLRNGLITVLSAAAAFAPPGAETSLPAFGAYLASHWYGALAPLVFAWLRAQQAFSKAKAPNS